MTPQLSKDTQDQIKQAAKTLLETVQDTPHHTFHFNYAPLVSQVMVGIFYETDVILAGVNASGEADTIRSALRNDLKDQFPALIGHAVLVVLDSLENVQRRGGWEMYYQ